MCSLGDRRLWEIIVYFFYFFFRDTLIVSLTNSATSVLAGFVIFSAIGYMAHVHNLPVDKIATDGKGFVLPGVYLLSYLFALV